MLRTVFTLEQVTRRNRARRWAGALVRKQWPNFNLYAYLARLFGKSVKVTIMGKQLYVDLRDTALSSALFSEGRWEPEETAFILKAGRKGMVFVDLGAHVGYYSVLASGIVGGEGRVIAFEPDPWNFALLRKNLAINRCRNVTIENKAVSNVSQGVLLYRSENNFGDHRIYKPQDDAIHNRGRQRAWVRVEGISLDEYFQAKPSRVDFIKMDIQGAEHAALIGMRKTLEKNSDAVILTEFWPSGLVQAGASPAGFLAEARNLGFLIHKLAEGGPRRIAEEEILESVTGDAYMTLILSRKELS